MSMRFLNLALRSWKKHSLLETIMVGCLVFTSSAYAGESSIPWQCTSYTYTEPTQEECIQTYSGDQGQKIAELERQLKRQEVMISELRNLTRRRTQQQVQVRNLPTYPPSYGFGPPPSFGVGQFGYGSLLGFGLGLIPRVAIVID